MYNEHKPWRVCDVEGRGVAAAPTPPKKPTSGIDDGADTDFTRPAVSLGTLDAEVRQGRDLRAWAGGTPASRRSLLSTRTASSMVGRSSGAQDTIVCSRQGEGIVGCDKKQERDCESACTGLQCGTTVP